MSGRQLSVRLLGLVLLAALWPNPVTVADEAKGKPKGGKVAGIVTA
jgi:hypothetical protein